MKTKTAPISLMTRKREQLALELRIQGLKYRDIPGALRQVPGIDVPASYNERHAWEDVQAAIDFNRKVTEENVTTMLEIEGERLEHMLAVIMPQVNMGDLKSIDRALKIMERKARLFGLDQPHQVTVRDWRTELIELIKSGKITLQQAREGLGNDELYRQLVESGGFGFLESGTAKTPEPEVIDAKLA